MNTTTQDQENSVCAMCRGLGVVTDSDGNVWGCPEGCTAQEGVEEQLQHAIESAKGRMQYALSSVTSQRDHALNTVQVFVKPLRDFRASQVAAGIPTEDLMPEDAREAVLWLIKFVPEWR